jgi:nucleoside diphosphate kinase
LEKEFKFKLSEGTIKTLTETFGVDCAKDQFAQIIEFMSGKHPQSAANGNYTSEELNKPGEIKCMILIYEGANAIKKIRDVLGPTDPLQAPDGTIRREFGSNIMVNTAHASDSPESYDREKAIINFDRNSFSKIIFERLGNC